MARGDTGCEVRVIACIILGIILFVLFLIELANTL